MIEKTSATDRAFKLLRDSRLSVLIKDKAVLNRTIEAAVPLIAAERLAVCDPASILGAIYKSVILGFRLEPEYGECHLIPKKMKTGKDAEGKDVWTTVCSFQIGYKGWKAKALESGHLIYLEAREVYKEDEFQYEFGMNPNLRHVPAPDNSGETTHFYALAKMAGGNGYIFEVINKQAAEKNRRNSETQYVWVGTGANRERKFSDKPKDIWANNYAQMALRVPIKRLCQTLPISAAIEAATMADGAVTYLQNDGTVKTIDPVEVYKASEEAIPDSPAVVVPDQQESYLALKGQLSQFEKIEMVCNLYKENAAAKLSEPFAALFFEAAARTAQTVEDLSAFYKLASAWVKTPGLVKILSNRKLEIEKDAKASQ